MPGLLVAGAVGIAGSALFVVPASVPSAAAYSPWALFLRSGGDGGSWNAPHQQQQRGFNDSSSLPYHSLLGGGGVDLDTAAASGGGGGGDRSGGGSGSGSGSGHALESAVWMLSVLFCYCVCFGNIGRWLALMGSDSSSSSSSSNKNNKNHYGSGSVSTAAASTKGRR